MKAAKLVAIVLLLLVLATAQEKPDWQKHIDWAIGNRTGPDQLDCPAEYARTYPECINGGGRACLMEKAIQSAKANDFDNAFRVTLITQCHNQGAQQSLGEAGKTAVGNYLKSK